jgi:hypothetical protein
MMRQQNVILIKPNLALFSRATPDWQNPVAPVMLGVDLWRYSRSMAL